jgi:hypothetical protein
VKATAKNAENAKEMRWRFDLLGALGVLGGSICKTI